MGVLGDSKAFDCQNFISLRPQKPIANRITLLVFCRSVILAIDFEPFAKPRQQTRCILDVVVWQNRSVRKG